MEGHGLGIGTLELLRREELQALLIQALAVITVQPAYGDKTPDQVLAELSIQAAGIDPEYEAMIASRR